MPSNSTIPAAAPIPISTIDVISKSTKNLFAYVSRHRPWPEFLDTISALDFPPSISDAILRFRRNATYFSINYSVIVAAFALASLIASPITLIIIGLVFYLWLVFHFFREDQFLVLGRQVNDFGVLVGLVLISIAAFWITGPMNSLSIGIGLGLVVSIIHGVLRNPEGLFLDENDAVSNGLIGRPPNPSSSGVFIRPSV